MASDYITAILNLKGICMLMLMEQNNDGGTNINADEVAVCPVIFKEVFFCLEK